MAITVTESSNGQKFSATTKTNTATKVFVVEGALSPFDAYAAAGIPNLGDYYVDDDFPATLFYATVQSKSVDNIDSRDDLHRVTVEYLFDAARSTNRPSNPVDGDEIYTFEPSQSTQKVNFGFGQDRFPKAPDPNPADDPGLNIGVNGEGEIAGVQLLDNTEILKVTQWISVSNFTPAFQNAVRVERNKINSVIWYGAAIGEALFIGMREVATNDITVELEFEFLISKNISEINIPAFKDKDDNIITVTGGKKGWQYLWTLSGETANPKKIFTHGVFLADVYYDSTFAGLGLTGLQT